MSKQESETEPKVFGQYGPLVGLLFFGVMAAIVLGALFRPSDSASSTKASGGVLDAMFGLLPWVIIFLVIFFILLYKLTAQMGEDLEKFYSAIGEFHTGAYDAAVQKMDALITHGSKAKNFRVLFLLSRGMLHHRLGQPVEAINCFDKVINTRAVEAPMLREILVQALAQKAECHLIMNALNEAEDAISVAEKFKRPARRGLLTQAKAMLLLRRNAATEACNLVSGEWHWADAVKIGSENKSLRMFWAFARSQSAGPDAHTETQQILAGLHPFRAGQFDYLTIHWPELRKFLTDNELSPRP
jgi:hypothetical protein